MLPTQKTLVQQSFTKILPIRERVGESFYARLFEVDPSLRPLFKGDLKVQAKALMGMIQTAVNGLDNLEKLVPAVQDLGKRHKDYGVKPEHYDTVGNALLWTFGKHLGPEFTPEVKAAWGAAYTVLATTMKAAAYAESE